MNTEPNEPILTQGEARERIYRSFRGNALDSDATAVLKSHAALIERLTQLREELAYANAHLLGTPEQKAIFERIQKEIIDSGIRDAAHAAELRGKRLGLPALQDAANALEQWCDRIVVTNCECAACEAQRSAALNARVAIRRLLASPATDISKEKL